MAHQALYRKYRSRNFSELVGQDSLVQTLRNQVMNNNVAHAYLFCGIRGTGKTSAAKILSRAVNCTDSVDGNPCNKCESCVSILNGSNVDVIEMDAASNNSVEDIRDIVKKVHYMPVSSKYKVYIIDEVHMLSKGAFNALLKTLEEPPAHVIFILATTESQKIPATILSRCQRFDLKRITTDDMVKHMEYVLKDMDYTYDIKALRVIASNADGAMRDALSILDRCMTFNEDSIEYNDVINLLGIVNFDTISGIADCIINKKIAKALTSIDELLLDGKDLLLLLDELILYFRNVLVYQATNTKESLIRVAEDNLDKLAEHSQKVSTDELVNIISKLSELVQECKRSDNSRIIFEVKIIDLIAHYDKKGIILNENIVNTVKMSNFEKKLSTSTENEGTIKSESTIKSKNENKQSSLNTNVNSVNEAVETKSIAIDSNGLMPDEDIYNYLLNKWQEILVNIRKKEITLFAVFRECKLKSVDDGLITFTLSKDKTWHYKAVSQDKNKIKITEILSELFGNNISINFIIEGQEAQESKHEITLDDIENDLKESFGDKLEIK